MKVSILIPTRDHYEQLNQCLGAVRESLLHSPDVKAEIIVLDGSEDTDETKRVIESQGLQDAFIVPVEQFWGFSQINNHGVTKAAHDNILLLNDDCYIQSTFWENLEIKPKEVMGFLQFFPDGTIQHAGVGIIRGFYPVHMGMCINHEHYAPGISVPCHAVTMSCTMMTKETFNDLGGLDEDYYFGYEDTDFCLKAWENGYKVRCYNDRAAIHEANASGGLLSGRKNKRFTPEYNMSVFRSKWAVKKGRSKSTRLQKVLDRINRERARNRPRNPQNH